MAIIIETCPICGHDLRNEVICTYPPIPRKSCPNCGWYWEGEQEKVVRIPFGGNANNGTTVNTLNDYLKNDTFNDSLIGNFKQSPCDNCSNNPKNGGSGMCNCILGLPTVTC